jgi:hypothetical protein
VSKSNTTETDILAKVFQATELSWDSNTSLYVSLHTADPGDGGSQTTSEATYGSYARVAVARDATGWDVSGDTASNDDLLQFPQATSGSNVITHVAIGTAASGAGQIIYSGALNSSLTVSTGIQPQFAPNALTTTED